MWKIKIQITLTDGNDTKTAQEHRATLEETLPGGFQSLEQWEQDVRQLGFTTMRQVFRSGLQALEQEVLASFVHHTEPCHIVKRGHVGLTLATVFGKVRFPRQRLRCHTCQRWLIPLNETLGLHHDEHEKTRLGLQELSSVCAINQPYRLAEKMIRQLTQDDQIISTKIQLLAASEGQRVRQQEEQERHCLTLDAVRPIQDRQPPPPRRQGTFYVCLDGIFVRSHEGKGRWREGNVGFLCTDKRQPLGQSQKQRVVQKRYITSFESAEVLGSRVYAQALKLGLHQYKEVMVLGDGARWIRQLRQQCFRHARYILDWFHLHENVCRAFRLTFPDDRCQRRQRRRAVTTDLWAGRKKRALKKLLALQQEMIKQRQEELLSVRHGVNELIEYIQNNWEGLINYQKMQQAGDMIASSLVEKAADIVIAKRQKKHQGMHWSHDGADGLCALRTLWLNEDWDQYWQQRRQAACDRSWKSPAYSVFHLSE
jgi:hypothetical protein